MEKVDNNQKYSELFSELKNLNDEYNRILAELASRGIEDVKSSAKEWSDEKLQALEEKMEEISKKAKIVTGKVKNAGKITLGLGILGVEAGIRGTKRAIKGAKTSYSKLKGKANEVKNFAKDKKDDAKKWVNGKVNDAKDWVEDKVDDVKDFVGDKKQYAKDWVGNKVSDAKKIGKVIKGRIIKGAKTSYSKLKGKANDVKKITKDKKEDAKKWVNGKAEDAKDWVENKVDDVKGFVDGAKIIKNSVKSELSSKKDDIIKDSKAKAGEFIDSAKQAKDRFDQRKNKTLLGTVRGIKSIATALEGKLEERILTDKEKVEKAQAKQPQKKQTKEMGMEME